MNVKHIMMALLVVSFAGVSPVAAAPNGTDGPIGEPPNLPDVTPDFVQDLLDGIWNYFDDNVAKPLGDIVSDIVPGGESK